MNISHKITATAILAATLAVGALAVSPAQAQGYYHPYHYGYRHSYHPRQYRHANRLDRRAAVAASHGRIYRAARLSNHATVIRSNARHGY